MLLDQISTTGEKKIRGNTNNLEVNSTKFNLNKIQSVVVVVFFFMKKENSAKVVIDETYLNIMKAKYDKNTANIIVNNEKLKTFPLKSALRLGCPHSSLLVLGILTTPFKEEQDIKRILIGKEEVKNSICT